jgi:hypothetical protein
MLYHMLKTREHWKWENPPLDLMLFLCESKKHYAAGVFVVCV